MFDIKTNPTICITLHPGYAKEIRYAFPGIADEGVFKNCIKYQKNVINLSDVFCEKVVVVESKSNSNLKFDLNAHYFLFDRKYNASIFRIMNSDDCKSIDFKFHLRRRTELEKFVKYSESRRHIYKNLQSWLWKPVTFDNLYGNLLVT